jgi:hypothetical protein
MPLGTTLPYGLRDVRIRPYTTLAATALAASGIDLPNSQTFTFNETEDYEDLRGDDKLITSHGKGPVLEWDLESGGINLDAYAAMAGGTIVDSGVTPNQIRKYTKLVTDVRPFFRVEGQAISDSGGDFHCMVYRARATKDLKGEFKDGAFLIPGSSGIGFGSLVSGETDKLYDFVQNETITAITP